MPEPLLPIVVCAAAFAAVLSTGIIILIGTRMVRGFGLLSDQPEDIGLEAPAPAPVKAGDRAAAAARAAAWIAAVAVAARARGVIATAMGARELAEWVALHDRTRGAAASSAASAASEAANRATAGFRANDPAAVEAAVLAATTAAEQVRALAAGLPDPARAERRKLLWLTAALVAALLLAAVMTLTR